MTQRPAWMSVEYYEEYQKFLANYFGPAAKDRYGAALPHFRSLINRPIDIIEELVDNPPDADATHIVVVIYPQVIIIYDNGHGMVPHFTEEGLELANERIVAIGKNSLGINDDLRAIVTDVSQLSLLWTAAFVGISGKAGRENKTGYRGLGIQAATQLGKSVEFITRPRPDLAKQFYSDPILQKDPPVYRWVMPTLEQVIRRQIDPVIEPYQGQFVDHNGHPILHGTMVKINNPSSEVLSFLRPENVVHALQTRHGSKIRAGLKVEVIDRFTQEGVKATGGIVKEVPPSQYKGHLIVDRSGDGNSGLFMKSGGKPIHFGAQIYWNPDRKDPETIMLRRNGIDFAPLSSAVENPPWNTVGLNGYIEIPDETIDDTGLTTQEAIIRRINSRYSQATTDKKKVTPGPHFNAWRQAIRVMEDLIPDAIKERQDEINRKAGDEITKQMQDLIRTALGEYDDISRIMSLPQVSDIQGSSTSTGTSTTRGPQVGIPVGELHVQVINEHNKGLSGVPLTIYRSKQEIASVTTISPAGIALQCGPGTYEVMVTLEPGWQLEEIKNPFPISLKRDEGKKLIFHVRTQAEVRPKKPRLPGIFIYSSSFGVDKADQLYDDVHFKEHGTVRYNSDHPDIKKAQEPGRESQWRSLIANMVTDAIMFNFLIPHLGESMARQRALTLFNRFIQPTVEPTKRTSKKRAAA